MKRMFPNLNLKYEIKFSALPSEELSEIMFRNMKA